MPRPIDMDSVKNYPVSLAGLELEHPWMNASGLIATAPGYSRLATYRTGAVVGKTVSRSEMKGHRPPVFKRLGEGTYGNAIGLANPGVVSFSDEMGQYFPLPNSVPFIFSMKPGESADETEETLKIMEDRYNAVELNVSCPNIFRGGMIVGTDPSLTGEFTAAAKKACGDTPLIVKLTPNTHLICDVAQAAVDNGADGLTAINTCFGMAMDPYTGNPLITNVGFGVSGHSIMPIGLRCVYQVRQKVGDQAFIIGCGGIGNEYDDGGIATAEDVIEYIRAGADAVAIGTNMFYRRPMEIETAGSKVSVAKYLDNLTTSFAQVMDEIGAESVADLKGTFPYIDD